MKDIDLDVSTPDMVSTVLRRAAEAYYDSAQELSAAWGDPHAGKPWTHIAKILERAADSIDKKI